MFFPAKILDKLNLEVLCLFSWFIFFFFFFPFFPKLAAEASQQFLWCIPSSTVFGSCLLHFEVLFHSVCFNHRPLFFCHLVDFSHFVLHFFCILSFLFFQLFLPERNVRVNGISHRNHLCLLIWKSLIDQILLSS